MEGKYEEALKKFDEAHAIFEIILSHYILRLH